MKKAYRYWAAILALVLLAPAPAQAQAVECSARGAILIEAETGKVLFEKNAHDRLAPASTTKIMTAILAIESCPLDDVVTVSENASGVEGSSIWLGVGEHMTLSDMLYGLMLSSGNDAAVAIAEHIGGDVESFVAMMNEKAAELGCKNTHFANPNGLYDDAHYTTAYDLSLIAAYAMKDPVFREIVATEQKSISWEGHEYYRVVANKNRLLREYQGGIGVKTGYTKQAGKCFVGAAERDGMTLIVVTLKASDTFSDSMALLDYGFAGWDIRRLVSPEERFEIQVREGVEETVRAAPSKDISLPLSAEEYKMVKVMRTYTRVVDAPVSPGDVLGSIEVTMGGETVAQADIIAISGSDAHGYGHSLEEVLNKWLWS